MIRYSKEYSLNGRRDKPPATSSYVDKKALASCVTVRRKIPINREAGSILEDILRLSLMIQKAWAS